MNQQELERRICAALGKRPMKTEELCRELHARPANVRNILWYLVFADRSVTCDRDDRFRLGIPPEDWPRLQRVHP